VPGVRAPVLEAIASARGPALVFDVAAIADTMRRIAAAARANHVRALFAAKSFPHPEVYALAGQLLDGFDLASPGELDAVQRATDLGRSAVVSFADPGGGMFAAASRRTIIVCETIDQVRAAPAHAQIAIRVSASITGTDPAIGAVLDGSGRRRSRFGLDDPGEVAALHRAADGRPVGLHVHHGGVVATAAARFVATACAALALADFEPVFLDLGGAWHGISDPAAAFAELRAAVPAAVELIVEPGRCYARDAGFACGRVVVARSLRDRELRVVELSRVCHLRWSQVELVARAPHPGRGRDVLVVGPTCFEDDVIGEWAIDPAELAIGAHATVRNVTGYALAWNTGFGGVPPADVVLVP
jgi:diaminopimelate decarboxylase